MTLLEVWEQSGAMIMEGMATMDATVTDCSGLFE